MDYISEPVVLCLGTFDGVHVGHQKLIRENLPTTKPGSLIKPVLINTEKLHSLRNLYLPIKSNTTSFWVICSSTPAGLTWKISMCHQV